MNRHRETFCVLLALGLLAGCAQVGPPLPPSLELPKPPSDLRASRKGNVVTLAWSEPTLTTDRQSLRYLGETHICRTAGADLNSCGTPVAQMNPLPQRPQPAASAQPTPLVYTDTLSSGLQETDPAGEVTYAVEVLNRDGRSAGLSNRARVPAAPTLPPPQDLAAQLTAEGVVLSWTGASGNANIPALQFRYRIYRREEGEQKDVVAGEIPAAPGPARFVDSSFEWEKTYFYRITPVTFVAHDTSEAQVEGDDSPAVRVVAHDVFPPSVPSGLQAVYSGEGQKPFIDLIWAPVTASDLAGYNVYRHDPSGASTKLNSELVKTPAYRDSAVEPGKTYIYAVSAVDVHGNESAKSEEASETVPEQH